VLLTTSRWSDIHSGLRDLLGNQIELRLGDPIDSMIDHRQPRSFKYGHHAKTVYIREDTLLDAVATIYGERVFERDRRDRLVADLATLDDRAARDREADRERLRRTLADLDRRQPTRSGQAQECGAGDPFAAGLRPADRVHDVAAAANTLSDNGGGHARVDAVRAPGGIRTHTAWCLRPSPLPVGLPGRCGGRYERSPVRFSFGPRRRVSNVTPQE